MKATKRFAWDVRPVALEANVVQGQKYRVTVLTEKLLRLEYSPEGVFEDRASQVAFYRDFPVCNFETCRANGILTVSTGALTLTYRENAAFNEESLSVKLDIEPASTWHYGEDFEDLGGTVRTLDRVDGECPLERGVCSRNGFSVLDDSHSLLLNEDGWIGVRKENTVDCYFFGYGFDYIGSVQALYRLTGVPPLLPAYALGNWWSRYHAYTQEEYLGLMDKFREENIPFTVGVVDMDWHIVNIPEELKEEDPKCAAGWTGYTWNRELFPDYKTFLKGLEERNLKTALNLHPAVGVCRHEEMYDQMAKACGIDPATGERVKLDLLDPEFMGKYFDILHHPYEKDGVNFWWMDWQQGTDYWWVHEPNKPGEYKDERERMDPLWLLNHLHIMDISRNGKRPMFFSRYSGPGSHRYPVGFSGDTTITWESLDFQPYFTATASNVGYAWWSHDIGGHMWGYRDEDLYMRWVQLGVFSPINRLHSTSSRWMLKEPWTYGTETEKYLGQWLRLRHSLFPYIYTMNYRNHTQLLPMVQPMYYSYPKCSAAYEVRNQFFFGSELMVAPITQKRDAVTGMGKTQAWLPKGQWFDFFSGRRYDGMKGRKLWVYRDLSQMPIFAKAGGIVPMAEYADHDNRLTNTENMKVLVFPGANNAFTMYEDAGDGSEYRDGASVRTEMTLDWSTATVFTVAPAQGDLSLIPGKRNWKIGLRGFHKDITATVLVNGKQVAAEITREGNTLWIAVTAAVTDKVEIQITGAELLHDNSDYLEECERRLQRAQCAYVDKNTLWSAVTDPKTGLNKKIISICRAVSADSGLAGAMWEMLELTQSRYEIAQILDK